MITHILGDTVLMSALEESQASHLMQIGVLLVQDDLQLLPRDSV